MATSFTARRTIASDFANGGRGVGDASDELRLQLDNHKTVLDEAVTAVNAAEAALVTTGAVTFGTLLAPTANTTVGWGWLVMQACTITGISVVAVDGAPSSSGGTYTLAVTGAGNNLLASATFDLETLVGDTATALSLTATTADLTLPAGSVISIAAVSDNADLTGHSGIGVGILATRTV